MVDKNIFEYVKAKDLILGLKFENIEGIMENSDLRIIHHNDLFSRWEKEKLTKIFNKNIIFQDTKLKNIYPFPVRNSKYNNFVLLYNGKKFFYFRKDMPSKMEVFYSKGDPIEEIKKVITSKLSELIEQYKYVQIVFPWINNKLMEKYYNSWQNFLSKNNKKHIGNIHFSYFMEVGYEPSS